jgi:hypothetical protein
VGKTTLVNTILQILPSSPNAVHIRGILGHAGTPVSDERQPWPAPLPAFLPASASATTSASA